MPRTFNAVRVNATSKIATAGIMCLGESGLKKAVATILTIRAKAAAEEINILKSHSLKVDILNFCKDKA